MKTVNKAACEQVAEVRKALDKAALKDSDSSNSHVIECRERVIEALADETADLTNVEAMAMLHGLLRDIEAIRLAATSR